MTEAIASLLEFIGNPKEQERILRGHMAQFKISETPEEAPLPQPTQ